MHHFIDPLNIKSVNEKNETFETIALHGILAENNHKRSKMSKKNNLH